MTQGAQTGALLQPRGVGWGGSWEAGSRGRGHVYLQLIPVDVWQKPTQYCTAIILQLKLNQLRKKQLGVLYTYLATCVHSSYRLKVIKGSGSSRK